MSRLELPVLPSMAWKYAAGLITVLLAAALYMLPNRMTAVAAVQLPLTGLDRAVPFWPWTGWVYAGVYALLLVAFFGLRDLVAASRFLYACLFTQAVAAACFVAYPTVYPRELFPVLSGTNPGAALLAGFLRTLDAPANCFPSLHVSTCVLCLAAFASSPLRRYLPLAGAASVLLIVSTLTFKQHYVADLVGGAALGLAGYGLFFRWQGIVLVPVRGVAGR
jgi:hypothetical protein